tara:strand:- start:9667 stop:9843 length:177 start_codon:yes stop_codon:yes gene_type:complete
MNMSDNRRIRRKNERSKKASKNDITKKDKTVGILAIALLFLMAVVLVLYFALNGVKIR